MSRNALIVLENLSKFYSADTYTQYAIKDIDLTVAEGEYLAIAGPSGCGKSTLLSIIGLLDSPSSGRYVLSGHEVQHFDAYQRAALRNKEIGLIFQAFNLIGDMTVLENVALPLTYRKLSRAERTERAMAVLARVNMQERANYYPSQLSGGQQQRVAVARGLVVDPSVLLADEPTGNLDSKNGEAIMDLLDELNSEGRTICMVTHDARFAGRATRVVELADGQIVADGGFLKTA